ncbi:hypothetical protein HDV05_002984, partial [Chytridiales sp. JEL 0842]
LNAIRQGLKTPTDRVVADSESPLRASMSPPPFSPPPPPPIPKDMQHENPPFTPEDSSISFDSLYAALPTVVSGMGDMMLSSLQNKRDSSVYDSAYVNDDLSPNDGRKRIPSYVSDDRQPYYMKSPMERKFGTHDRGGPSTPMSAVSKSNVAASPRSAFSPRFTDNNNVPISPASSDATDQEAMWDSYQRSRSLSSSTRPRSRSLSPSQVSQHINNSSLKRPTLKINTLDRPKAAPRGFDFASNNTTPTSATTPTKSATVPQAPIIPTRSASQNYKPEDLEKLKRKHERRLAALKQKQEKEKLEKASESPRSATLA